MKKVIFALCAVFVLTAFIPKETFAKKKKVDKEITVNGEKYHVVGFIDVEGGKLVGYDILVLGPDGEVYHIEKCIRNIKYDEKTNILSFDMRIDNQLIPIELQLE